MNDTQTFPSSARILTAGAVFWLALDSCFASGATESPDSLVPPGNPKTAELGKPGYSVHDFVVFDIEGRQRSLQEFAGKAVMIVNTASNCGYTYQYEGLQALYDTYRERGFEILAFPSNDFMGQEPGSNEEIAAFCKATYKTTFELFSKIIVNGPAAHPLYQWLVQGAGGSIPASPIGWNFTKFLVSPEGKVVGRWDSKVEPQAEAITRALDALLPKS